MNIKLLNKIVLSVFFLFLIGCSSPEQKLASFIEDGFEALEKNKPDEALNNFRRALELNRKSNQALWGLILTFEMQGNYRKVFDLCRQLVEQDPSNIEAHFKLANLYLLADMYDFFDDQTKILEKLTKNNADLLALKAEKAFKQANPEEAKNLAEQALLIDANNMSALMTLARISGRDGHIDEALSHIDTALAKHTNENSLYLAKISLLRDGMMLDKIAAVYDSLIKLNPGNFQFKKELALFLVEQREYNKAENLLREILKEDPKNIEAQVGLVKLTMATKSKAAAKQLFEKFSNANPDSMPLKFAHYNFFKEIGEFDQAKALIKKAIKDAKDMDDKLKATAFYADDLLELGMRPDATKLVDEVIIKDPKNRDGLMVKAKLAMFDQRFNSAIGIYRNILDDYPNDLAAMIALGKAYEMSGTIELANEAYVQAYHSARGVNEVQDGYVDFLIKYQFRERAEQVVQEWVTTSPNNPYFLKKLALLKLESARYDEAERIAQKFIDTKMFNALGYQLLGLVRNQQKQYTAANDAFLKAFTLEPDNAVFLQNLADSYLSANLNDKAISFLQGINDKQPVYYVAQLKLASIRANTTPEVAASMLLNLIQQYPDKSEAYLLLAELHRQQKKHLEAKLILEQCLTKLPDHYDCQGQLAVSLINLKQYEQAIVIYRKLVATHPTDIKMRNNLASMLIDYSPDPAQHQYAFYLAETFVNTDEAYLNDTYGWAALKLGKTKQAITALLKATKGSPEIGMFHFHLAKAYQADNQEKLAKQSMAKANKLHNENSLYPLEEL